MGMYWDSLNNFYLDKMFVIWYIVEVEFKIIIK